MPIERGAYCCDRRESFQRKLFVPLLKMTRLVIPGRSKARSVNFVRSPKTKIIVLFSSVVLVGVLAIVVGPAKAAGPWHDGARPYRITVTFDPGGVDRLDVAAPTAVDFTTAFAAGGAAGETLDLTSISVVEVTSGGDLVDASVPFQFDHDIGFDATTAATGQLVVLLEAATTVTRHYHVYFRSTATPGSFTQTDHSGLNRVTVDTDASLDCMALSSSELCDEGRAVTVVSNSVGEWFYDMEGGGFTSINDIDGADWISWNTDTGSAGQFRGIPNLVHPDSTFHPGFDNSSTVVDASGPLRAVLTTTSDDGERVMRWSFYRRHATAEVLDTPAGEKYWFQYEGTPGGSLGSEDKIIQNDGTTSAFDDPWINDLADIEWVAAADTTKDRSLYMAQLDADTALDSYTALDGAMTVLAFGRSGLNTTQLLTGQRTFVVGFVPGSTSADIADPIAAAITPFSTTSGSGESTPTTTTTTTTVHTQNDAYWIVTSTGRVMGYGPTGTFGDAPGGASNVVAAAQTASGNGYWLVRSTGEVIALGDAADHGDILDLAIDLNSPIVGMAPTPSGNGYWLLGGDGGIFTFGDAGFFGSTGDLALKAPVIDMEATPTGLGYYLVALDGGIFTFGDARFLGSTGDLVLDKPVVSLTIGDNGYWLVALDGGIFAFGEPFLGSIPGVLPQLAPEARPEGRRIRATPSGSGYLIVTADGGIFSFGNALFFGSAADALVPGEVAVDLMMLP